MLKVTALMCFMISKLHAAEPSIMNTCELDMPGWLFRISLPEGAVSGSPPKSVYEVAREGLRITASDEYLKRDGYKAIFEWLYDYKSRFGFSAYGSLRVLVIVRRINAKDKALARTESELYEYLKQHTKSEHGFTFEHSNVNGTEYVRRYRNTFERYPIGGNAEELEIFSRPLTNDLFVDVGFNVMEWKSGKASLWRNSALELRDRIKATMSWERRAKGPP